MTVDDFIPLMTIESRWEEEKNFPNSPLRESWESCCDGEHGSSFPWAQSLHRFASEHLKYSADETDEATLRRIIIKPTMQYFNKVPTSAKIPTTRHSKNVLCKHKQSGRTAVPKMRSGMRRIILLQNCEISCKIIQSANSYSDGQQIPNNFIHRHPEEEWWSSASVK